MSQNLHLLVKLSAMDKLSTPFQKAQTAANKLAQSLKHNKGVFSELKKAYDQNEKQIKKYADTLNPLKAKLRENTTSLKQAYAEVRRMETAMKGMANPTSAFVKKLEQAKKTVANLKQEQANTAQKLKAARAEFSKNGFEASKMSQKQSELRRKMREANQAIDQQRQKLEALNQKAKANAAYQQKVATLKQNSERLANFGQRSMITGAAITAPIVAAGKGVVGMAQTAGKFEQFNSILEITEGSSEKAQKSFDWVKQFAVDTPSNLDEAMEAFVKLRAYGLDPTNGLLKTLGDTGAAMGKSVMQAVEAIADALQGENERLKEFGVKGSVVKGTNIIEYSYTDKNGKQQVARVNKNNREEIEKALTKIFNEKYNGAMEKQSKTLLGVWAKLDDHWTNFQMKIMQTGAFDWIKNKIQTVLDTLDKMQANGELQKWAEDIGSVIKEVIQGFWAFGEKILEVIKKVAEFARENKGAIATIVQWGAMLGSSLTIFGAFSMVLSFALYPITRLIYGIGHLTKINQLFSATIDQEHASVFKVKKSWFSYKTTLNTVGKAKNRAILSMGNWITQLKTAPTAIINLLTKMKTMSFWLNGLRMIAKVALSPLRLALSAIGALFSPIGLAIAGISLAGIALYKNWETVKAFFGGFWTGLKQGLAPVIEKFKPLATIFNAIVEEIKSAAKWFTDLLSPVETTQKNLDEAASAGKKFGEWIAAGIDVVTKPLQWLMDSIQWVIDNMQSITNTAKTLLPDPKQTERVHIMANNMYDPNATIPPKLDNHWSGGLVGKGRSFATGGYTGNGGKYTPMGIVHGGEYVMTKQATSRLGVRLLDGLNYGKNALVAAGMGISVASAQPIMLDQRPPISQKSATVSATSQPMQVTININGAGQTSVDIAKEVQRELARLESQRQARQRSALRDRD